MKLNIYGDLSYFWQWDLNRKLVVDDDGVCSQVHFCNGTGPALVCLVRDENGLRVADVPNILLQKDEPIRAYLYTTAEDGARTRRFYSFDVLARAKPEEYVYTETEALNYAHLDERLKNLEGEGLAQALADYLKENPVQAGATAEEAAQIQQNKTDIKQLAQDKLSADALPEAVNDALAQAKASGEFDGNDYVLTEADKQEIAEMVEVPSGGGGSGIIVSDSAPEDTSVLWVDPTDNTTEVPENSGKKSVTSYNCPTEVPLESGSQYILYGSTGGTISVQVGSNENNKVDYQFSSGFDVVWLLYVQTSEVQGSIIATSGTRKVINFEGDSSKMKISSTIPFWIVIKVG